MNLRPMIVPRLEFFLKALLRQLFIYWCTKRWKDKFRWAFDNWLTFAIEWESTLVTLVSSKLTSDSYNVKFFTISNKYGTFTWCYKDITVLAVINIDISCDIKDKIAAIFTIIDIKLLFFYWIDFLDFERIRLIFETVIIRIIFFLNCLSFRLQYISMKFRCLFNRLNRRLLFFYYLILFIRYRLTCLYQLFMWLSYIEFFSFRRIHFLLKRRTIIRLLRCT